MNHGMLTTLEYPRGGVGQRVQEDPERRAHDAGVERTCIDQKDEECALK